MYKRKGEKKRIKEDCYTEKGEREIERKERQRNRETKIARRAPPISSTIIIKAPPKERTREFISCHSFPLQT